MRKRLLVLTAFCAMLCAMASCSDDATPATYTPSKTHGEYLVKSVSGCGDCHTPHNQNGSIDSLSFAGGEPFVLGALGTVYARNITPDSATGIGSWTDDQIITAIRTGVAARHIRSNGQVVADSLFPVMPYLLYAYMTDNDVKDIVAFLRTLPAIRFHPPDDTVAARPLWSKQQGIPDGSVNSDQTKRGKYLVTIAGCIDCHTKPSATPANPFAEGYDMSNFLGGGVTWYSIGGVPIKSPNLSSDKATGLGNWRASQIDSAFALGWDDEGKALCPPMPWRTYQNMTKADCDAIVAYLQSIPAVSNEVEEKDPSFVCPH